MEQIWIHEINSDLVNLEDYTGHKKPSADNSGNRGMVTWFGLLNMETKISLTNRSIPM